MVGEGIQTLENMLTHLISAYLFVKNNYKLVGVVTVLLIILYFIVGFYILRDQRDDLRVKLLASEKKVAQLEKDIVDITNAHIELAKQSEELRKKKDELIESLNRPGKKSLTELARAKPGLVEKAINSGTEKILKCVEIVTSGGDC
jgi:uncharacterized membrane protein YciS (DUF1049 family)